MADNNSGGFIGGLAGAVKSEQKDIHTTGKWEDVDRIRAQTFNLAGLRVWQLVALTLTVIVWSYVWYKYSTAEVVLSNQMTQVIGIIVSLLALLAWCVITYDVWTRTDDRGVAFAVSFVTFGVYALFVWQVVPIVVWSLMNVVLLGVAPVGQIVLCGWLPVMMSIISLSIVPDFQIGRFAFWRELTNQPAASSEKSALDVTAIELKRMEIEAKHDDMTDAERANYEAKIVELQDKIDSLMKSKPVTRLVPFNHGTARSVNGSDFNDQEWENLRLFLTGWSKRGISRDAWCTEAAERKYGSRIPEPDWYKFRDVLRGLGVYDANNKPLMSADEASNILKIDIYDED